MPLNSEKKPLPLNLTTTLKKKREPPTSGTMPLISDPNLTSEVKHSKNGTKLTIMPSPKIISSKDNPQTNSPLMKNNKTLTMIPLQEEN